MLKRGLIFAAGLVMTMATHASAADRLPTISPDAYTPEQKAAADSFLATRKTPVFGPFEPLMHSPDLMTLSRQMGDYLRYKSSIGNTLSEFVIIVTAREWTQDYEWQLHAGIAAKQGIMAETIAAIADGRRPDKLTDDEAILYAFVTELHHTRRVSDTTYDRTVARFGTRGVADILGITGYYTYLAMVLNVAHTPIPADAKPLPRLP
jgi:4-carboxymuconolactone decarboxylase